MLDVNEAVEAKEEVDALVFVVALVGVVVGVSLTVYTSDRREFVRTREVPVPLLLLRLLAEVGVVASS